jgi:hypothetical protein
MKLRLSSFSHILITLACLIDAHLAPNPDSSSPSPKLETYQDWISILKALERPPSTRTTGRTGQISSSTSTILPPEDKVGTGPTSTIEPNQLNAKVPQETTFINTPRPQAPVPTSIYVSDAAKRYRTRAQSAVNLGGWLVTEKWLKPALYECTGGDQVGELSLARGCEVVSRPESGLMELPSGLTGSVEWVWVGGVCRRD